MREYCCNIMEYYATNKNSLIEYVPETRSYSFYLLDHPHGTRQKMYYCFWCGSQLPEDFSEEWEKILREEYGIEDAGFTWNQDNIPPEFKTDKWWKNRGLASSCTHKDRDQTEIGVFIPMSEFTKD